MFRCQRRVGIEHGKKEIENQNLLFAVDLKLFFSDNWLNVTPADELK